MVAGDDALAEETAAWLPWAEAVVVKHAVSRRAAASVHPSVAHERIREGARRAVERAAAGDLGLLVVPAPVVIEVDYANPGQADHAAIVPGAIRVGDRGVRHPGPDAETAYRGFLAGLRIVSGMG
jgi:D-amino peptidase